jgi:hypothetical protein
MSQGFAVKLLAVVLPERHKTTHNCKFPTLYCEASIPPRSSSQLFQSELYNSLFLIATPFLLEHLFLLIQCGMLEELRHQLSAYPMLDDHQHENRRGGFL